MKKETAEEVREEEGGAEGKTSNRERVQQGLHVGAADVIPKISSRKYSGW